MVTVNVSRLVEGSSARSEVTLGKVTRRVKRLEEPMASPTTTGETDSTGSSTGREPATEQAASEWHHVTLALLGGLAVASVLFAHIAVVQTPGLDPPPETAALFIVAGTASAIGYLLVKQDSALGYPVGMLAGLVIVVEVAVVVTGSYGTAGPETNPVGPAVYVALAVAVVVTSAVAWRRRTANASRRRALGRSI